MANNATHALAALATLNLTFNDDEEDIIIHNGWTPEEREELFEINLFCSLGQLCEVSNALLMTYVIFCLDDV